MTKTPSVGTSVESGAESRSGLVSNYSIIWNSESSARTMLELELVMPSSTNDRNALLAQNLTNWASVILCSSGLLYCSASYSSGEKNLASRFVARGDRSGSVSANHDDSNSDSDLDSTRPTRK